TERAVEIGEHPVKETLGQSVRLRPLGLESMKIQESMQANQLETSVKCVRHAIIGEKDRSPSVLDHVPVGNIGSITDDISLAAGNHRERSLRSETLTINESRLNL